MAKGYNKHREREEALSLLGKDLARRARSKCELCEGTEGKLTPYEPPPVDDEPELERTLLACPRCRDGASGGPLGDPSTWRFLETVVWAEVPAVQVTAIRLLRRLAESDVAWARDAADGVYPSEAAAAWLADD